MIFDTVSSMGRYRHLSGMDEVMNFMNENPLDTLSLGRYELPNGLWCTISESNAKETGAYEVHRKYADVQIVLAGSERIDWMPLEDHHMDYPFSAEDDIGFFHGESSRALSLHLLPGTFAIFYPEDAHKPLLRFQHDQIRKAVFKIPVTNHG